MPTRTATLPCLLCGSLLLAAAAPPGRDDLPDAAVLLAQMEAHTGSPEHRARLRAVVYRGEVAVPGMEDRAQVEELLLAPGRCRMNAEWKSMGMSMTMGCTPDFAWGTDPAVGIMVTHGAAAGPVRRLFGILGRAHWQSLYARAETIGREEVGGRACVKLAMIPAEGAADHWLVDPEARTLVRHDTELPGPMGEVLACQYRFEDWRRVDGVLFPGAKVQVVGAMEIRHVYTAIEVNPDLDVDLAGPPADVIAKASEGPAAAAPPAAGEFQIETMKVRPVASIRQTVAMDGISNSLAVMLPEVMSYISQCGGQIAGPPFSRYHRFDGDQVDLEAGIPVQQAIPSGERVKASELPGGRCATTWHIGPYTELERTWAVLRTWVESQGLESVGGFFEMYWTDPGIQPDPSKWKTQIVWPVKE